MTTNLLPNQEIQPAYPGMVPDTINILLTAECNFRCKHCYATFADIPRITPRFMTEDVLREILIGISREPLPPGILQRKITYVGGEPTLCSHLVRSVRMTKDLGLITAVITNGTRITPRYLDQFNGSLDWMGFSIDSFAPHINQAIGRCRTSGVGLTADEYAERINWVKERNIALKINTVVNAYNWQEDMTEPVIRAHPDRWKVLQVTPIAGQNDTGIEEMQVTPRQFQHFVHHHSQVRQHGVVMVAESVEVVRGSYAMISPDGRFIGNESGSYTYSEPILKVGVGKAFSQVAFDADKFHSRGGRYLTPGIRKQPAEVMRVQEVSHGS